MHVIHKFEIRVQDEPVRLSLPLSAKIVHVAPFRHEILNIWVEIPVHADMRYCSPIDRCFQVFGTGENIPGGRQHVCSAIAAPFVWHLYEVKA